MPEPQESLVARLSERLSMPPDRVRALLDSGALREDGSLVLDERAGRQDDYTTAPDPEEDDR